MRTTIINFCLLGLLFATSAQANDRIDIEYVKDMKTTGLRNLDLDDIVKLAEAGATPKYVRDLKRLGLRNFDASDAIKLSNAKITVDYARAAKAIPMQNFDTGDLLKIAATDAPLSYLKGMKSAHLSRLQNFDESDLIKLYQAGITPKYAQGISNLGLRNFDANDMAKLFNANVSPEYAHEMKRVGLRNFDENDLIKLSNAKITTKFAREAKTIGMNDADDVIKLAQKFGDKIPLKAATSKPSSSTFHLNSIVNGASSLGLMLLLAYAAYRFYQKRATFSVPRTDDIDTRITHFEKRVGDLQDILISIDDRLSRQLNRI